MIRYKIRNIAFECDEVNGTGKVLTAEREEYFSNAIEGWNSFVNAALHPLECELRDKLEENGFNRWTGRREHLTESELKIFDDLAAVKMHRFDI